LARVELAAHTELAAHVELHKIAIPPHATLNLLNFS